MRYELRLRREVTVETSTINLEVNVSFESTGHIHATPGEAEPPPLSIRSEVEGAALDALNRLHEASKDRSAR